MEQRPAELELLFQAAFSQNNLDELTEAVANLLKNPIAVYDSNYCILAHSSTTYIRDSVWLEGMKRGYCRYEYAAQLSKLTTSSQDSQIITCFGDVRRRQAVLRMGDVLVGYYSVLESETPFCEVPQEYYDIAAKFLAKEISMLSAFSGHYVNKGTQGILIDLLNGSLANQTLFRQRLSGSELDYSSVFRLITIDTENYSPTGQEQLQRGLTTIMPSAPSVYYEKAVVLLFDCAAAHEKVGKILSDLERYLEQEHLRCCISDQFDDLYCLREQYLHTIQALETAATIKDMRTVLPYEDYKLLRVIRLLSPEEIPFLCSTAVWAIYSDDRKNQSNNLETLFMYLHNGKSLQKTADTLYIHRNTVTYRLQRISEKYNIDFRDEYRNIHHYMSCMMLDTLSGHHYPFFTK